MKRFLNEQNLYFTLHEDKPLDPTGRTDIRELIPLTRHWVAQTEQIPLSLVSDHTVGFTDQST